MHQQNTDNSTFIDVLSTIRKNIQIRNQALFENEGNQVVNTNTTTALDSDSSNNKTKTIRHGLCILWHNMTTDEQQKAMDDFVDCEYTHYTVNERRSIHAQLIQQAKHSHIKWNGSFISHIDNLMIDIEDEDEDTANEDTSEKKVKVWFRKDEEQPFSTHEEDTNGNLILETDKSPSKTKTNPNESVHSMMSRLQLEKGTFFAS